MMTLCSETGDSTMTFKECLDKSVQIAHYFRSQGIKKVNQNIFLYCHHH